MITSGRNICGRGRMDNNARSNDGEEVDPSDRPTDRHRFLHESLSRGRKFFISILLHSLRNWVLESRGREREGRGGERERVSG